MVDLWLIVLLAVPVLLTYFLKSNAALSFLALCAGFVLLSLTTSDLQKVLDHANIVRLSTDTVGLILLCLPPLLTLLITRRSVHGQSNQIIQLIPAICLGGLLALIAVPLLNASLRSNFTDAGLWGQMQKIQPWIIGVGSLSSLLIVWTENLKSPRKKK